MSNDDPDRLAAAQLAQELMATAKALIDEATALADKHRFMLHFGLIDDRHYFPRGSNMQHPVCYYRGGEGLRHEQPGFEEYDPWCGVDVSAFRYTEKHGEWLSSSEYGDCG